MYNKVYARIYTWRMRMRDFFIRTALPQKFIHSVYSLPLEKQVEKSLGPVEKKFNIIGSHI